MNWKIKCSYLKYDLKLDRFQLNVVLENLLIPECKDEGVLGIDRGLRNLAVCSNNIFYNSNETKRIKGKFAFLRAQLQSKGTRSEKEN